MPRFENADWYDHPRYYDVVFDPDTPLEADFLEDVHAAYGRTGAQRRVLEPACGTGRLLVELSRRGWTATGFDLNERMLEYARSRPLRSPNAKPLRLFAARMESFEPCPPCDFAFCLLSTFKYILTGRGAAAHLRRVAASLVRSGIYVFGIHLTDYSRRFQDHERWTGDRAGIRVVSTTDTWPANRRTRTERLRNRMIVREQIAMGSARSHRLESKWMCRTYDAKQLRALIARVPEFEVVACHDFNHDIHLTREFDDAKEDIVVVLRKR
jgi:SAM-dependent methyltransferase